MTGQKDDEIVEECNEAVAIRTAYEKSKAAGCFSAGELAAMKVVLEIALNPDHAEYVEALKSCMGSIWPDGTLRLTAPPAGNHQ